MYFIKIILFLFLFTKLLYAQEITSSEGKQENKSTETSKTNNQAQQTQESPIKETIETLPFLEIKRLEKEDLYSLELRNVDLSSLFRVLAHDYELNFIVSDEVEGKISASLTNVSLEEAISTISEIAGLTTEKKGNIIYVKPNLITKVFILKNIEAKKILEETISSSNQEAISSSKSTLYHLLSKKGKVLLGVQPNSLVIIDYPKNIKQIEEYLNAIDKGMESKIFKLKYINVKDIVGIKSSASQQSSSTSTSSSTTTKNP